MKTDFAFDAGGNRSHQLKQRIASDGTVKLEKTTYLGSYERELHQTKATATADPVSVRTVHRHSIGGFAVYTRSVAASGVATIKLTTILKDHLGSTDVLYTGTWNGSTFANATDERQSFDAWGERRDPASLAAYRATDGDAFRTSGNDYDRGYTGHEQLDDSGLIHMNGRLYDPELGRMLSPDPFVQVPEFSQNFNRYSYVMNNPLNLTDPTGFSFVGDLFKDVGGWLKQNWRTVAVIVVAVIAWYSAPYILGFFGASSTAAGGLAVTGSAASWGALAAQGAVTGFISGAASAGINGGSLGDVLRGALVGAIQGAIAGGVLHGMAPGGTEFSFEMAKHIAGHGVLGGAANLAMGGKFQDGFISAAVTAGAADLGFIGGGLLERTIKAGIIGGTASALGGGKFANGAFTGAFQYLTNEAGAEARESLEAYVNRTVGPPPKGFWQSVAGALTGDLHARERAMAEWNAANGKVDNFASLQKGMAVGADIASMAVPGIIAARASGTSPLYRAVMDDELADIKLRNQFRNPSGNEVKYFSETAVEAARYAQGAYGKFGDTSPYTIVTTRAPSSLIQQYRTPVIEYGIGPVTLPTSQLNRLGTPRVLSNSPFPE